MYQERGIEKHLHESCQLLQKVANSFSIEIEHIATLISNAFKEGKKLLIMGNGGSASQAQHLAAELVGNSERSLPAIALTTDTSILTAVGNDLGFKNIFQRQIEALAEGGDIILALSTSGQSANILWGLIAASRKEAIPIALLGGDGGSAMKLVTLSVIIPSSNTALIQEAHLSILHAICGAVKCYTK